MARLPTPGGDDGTWGDILNEYLQVEHNTDGTQKDGSITAAKVAAANKDGLAGVASMRTLGTGVQQAAAGSHDHEGTYLDMPEGTPAVGEVPIVTDDNPLTLGWGAAGAGLPDTILTKTANYTAAADEYIQADATSGGFTITLPASPTTGALVAVKKIDATSNIVTIAPSGGGTIDGDSSATTATRWAGAIFEHLGSNVWAIVASMSTTGPQGPTGPQGETGPQGPTGATGTPGGGLLPRVLLPGRYVTMPGTVATTAPALNTVLAFPFEVFATTTFVGIGINVSVAGGAGSVLRLGVYSDDGGKPGNLVVESAAIAATTTGAKEEVINQSLSAGIYWLAFLCQVASPTVSATSGGMPVVISSATQAGAMQNSPNGFSGANTVTSGGFPASWGATYTQVTIIPRVVLKTA